MKVNHIPGCVSKIKGSGLRGATVLYAQHSCRLLWNTEPDFQVSFPHHQRRDVDELERAQKAATTMVSWLEDTTYKEKLRGGDFSRAEEKTTRSWERHNLIEVFHCLKVKAISKN